MMTQISALIFGLLAAAACIVAFRSRRTVREMARRSDELVQALAARDTEHHHRILRLEHDLKSPLGAILGFSTLLRELLQDDVKTAPPAVLKSVNGIGQAARKMLQIVEAAGASNSDSGVEETAIERSH